MPLVAFDKFSQTVILAEEIENRDRTGYSFTCIGCEKPLFFRSCSTKKAHFCHFESTKDDCHSLDDPVIATCKRKDLVEQVEAKYIISHYLNTGKPVMISTNKCAKCQASHNYLLALKFNSVRPNVDINQSNIALYDNDQLVYSIEISKKSRAKTQPGTGMEVKAANIIRQYNTFTSPPGRVRGGGGSKCLVLNNVKDTFDHICETTADLSEICGLSRRNVRTTDFFKLNRTQFLYDVDLSQITRQEIYQRGICLRCLKDKLTSIERPYCFPCLDHFEHFGTEDCQILVSDKEMTFDELLGRQFSGDTCNLCQNDSYEVSSKAKISDLDPAIICTKCQAPYGAPPVVQTAHPVVKVRVGGNIRTKIFPAKIINPTCASDTLFYVNGYACGGCGCHEYYLQDEDETRVQILCRRCKAFSRYGHKIITSCGRCGGDVEFRAREFKCSLCSNVADQYIELDEQ